VRAIAGGAYITYSVSLRELSQLRCATINFLNSQKLTVAVNHATNHSGRAYGE
jgi:hypothetical protein